MPIYMKYDGIDGAVTEATHKQWIELESCQLGVHRNITSASGRGHNREAGIASVGEIVVTKNQDCASAKLFRAALDGSGKKVTIDFVRVVKDKVEKFMQIELENTLISSYTVSGSGGDTSSRPMESLALNYVKITYHAITGDSENKVAKPDRASYDLATAKAS